MLIELYINPLNDMKKVYTIKSLLLITVAFLLLAIASCKKEKPSIQTTNVIATPTTLGLYESDSSIYKELDIAISQIGTQSIDYGLVFDTGSGGMVIDANGILPSSMIGRSGFKFAGDSTVVNGITITSQTSIIEYGADSTTTDKVYGNLAYASVTVGDQNGNIVIKRLPFFLYYKAVDPQGNPYEPHLYDTFGVSEEYDVTFSGNAYISSPFSYFDPGSGLTKGFKMAALGTNYFSYQGTYAPGVITLGLTSSDISSSSGFVMSKLYYFSGDGYAPVIPATITYNGKSVSTEVIFDTGTEPYSYIEDPTFNGQTTLLPQNTPVAVAATSGFNYDYTISASDNLTYIENPNTSGGGVSIISLEYFLNNEYMLNFANHSLGLKNN
jgi:hypothetical protein